MNLQDAKQAIEAYFTSEAAEMYCIIGGAVVLLLLAIALWVRLGDRFSIALALALLLVAGILATGGIGLLVRDTANRHSLIQVVEGHDQAATTEALGAERERMQDVVDNYPNLRYMFAACAVLAALLIAFTANGWAHALAVALLLFSLSGVVIDQYSERRAVIYLERLDAAMVVAAPGTG